jgi:rhamnogalacturonan endolyase
MEERMQREQVQQRRVGRIIASSLYAIGVGILFPACGSSGSGTTAPGAGGTTGNETASSSEPTSSGGSSASATTVSTGGNPNTGGNPATGGNPIETGGVPSSGGNPTDTGGVPNPGGQPGGGRGGGGRGGGGTPVAGRGGGGVPNPGGTPTDTGGGLTGGAVSSGGVPTPGSKPPAPLGKGHYQMENLDRGVVAVKVTGGVYVGWRMFGYEYTGTDSDTTYNLYKDGTKLANVTDSTNYLDAAGTSTSKYTVSCVLKGVEGPQSTAVAVWAQQYQSIALSVPPKGTLGGTYTPNDASPGDLDGDGQMDIVLKWDPSNSQDSSFSNKSDTVIIDGVKIDGTKLWRIDLGVNIRAGAHDTQMSVYDFDGDGKAEFACKTGPGTKDGQGNFLKTGPAAGADNTADLRGPRGMTLGGPEWLTVFDGTTGAERATIEYPVLYASHSWGDTNGNRSQRFNGGFAFVKDVPAGGGAAVANGLPSIIQQRGYYTVLTVSALTYRGGVLAKNWVYDSVTAIPNGGGDHSCMAADVDGDGAQEIIPGARIVNSDGTFRCDSGMGHGDAMDIAELIPGKGITVFSIHEQLGGSDAHDGATCATFYYKITNPGTDANRGRAEYVGAGDETSASCNGGGATGLCLTGTGSAPSAGSNFVIYWDDDEWRETEDAHTITKGGASVLDCATCLGNNSTKNTPTLTADILGDWREEIIWRESSGSAIRLYTTTDVTKRRIYTLMHDPTYRAQVNFEQASYNQPPHTGFRISPNMAAPPVPDIFVK